MIRQPLIVAALALLLSFAPAVQAAADPPPAKPNFLFILIDDMGSHDLSSFGGKPGASPEIDKLAREGIRFTQFYDPAPICSPSRTGFLTGQYPGRWRVTSFLASRKENAKRGLADWLDPMAPTVARSLQQAGYYTAHVGKWHLGGQRDVDDAPFITEYGFDSALGSMESLGERVLADFEPVDGKPFNHGPTESNRKVGKGKIHRVARDKVTAAYVDRAIAEMNAAKAAGKPFYINLWPDDVHSPVFPPKDLRGDGSPVARYLGVLKEMDKQLGRAFDFIRSDAALRDNTVIVLASDNGPEGGLGSAGQLRGTKGQLYEGGIRSPLIVWWPGGMPKESIGGTNDVTVVCGIDLSPSLLALAGAKAPEGVTLDGVDLSAAFAGRSTDKRGTPVMWMRPPDRPGPKGSFPDLAIRDGDWKLLVDRDGSEPELFNVIQDPNEKKNLAPEQPERVKELSARVIEWDKNTNEAAPPGPRSGPKD